MCVCVRVCFLNTRKTWEWQNCFSFAPHPFFHCLLLNTAQANTRPHRHAGWQTLPSTCLLACINMFVHTHKHSIWGKMSSKKHCHYSITSAIHYFLSLSSPELQFTFCCHQCYHGSHPQTNWRRLANKKRLIGETSKLRPFSLSFSLLLLPLSGVPIINRYLRTFHRVGVSLSASYNVTKLTNGADIVSTLAHTHTRTHAHNYKYPIL